MGAESLLRRQAALVSVTEIAAHMAPARPELRSFLEKIGECWLPLTNDPFQVIQVQNSGVGVQAACVSHSFINDADFLAKLQAGNLSLVHVVDLTRGGVGAALKADTDKSTQKLCHHIARRRREYGADRTHLEALWPRLPFDAVRSMKPIYNSFVRSTISGDFPFGDNQRDVPQFLTDLSAWPASRGRHDPPSAQP